jgi:hypothetical protein
MVIREYEQWISCWALSPQYKAVTHLLPLEITSTSEYNMEDNVGHLIIIKSRSNIICVDHCVREGVKCAHAQCHVQQVARIAVAVGQMSCM